MGDISFGANGLAIFPTKYHGEVTLSKKTWDHICDKPERWWFKHNGDKLATTLIAPDYIRYHQHEPVQVFYYKYFERFWISERIDGPMPCKCIAIPINTASKRICTAYPVEKPKPGIEYKPVEGKT